MTVDGQAMRRIHHALTDAFNRFSLRQMVRFELDEHLYRISGGDSLDSTHVQRTVKVGPRG